MLNELAREKPPVLHRKNVPTLPIVVPANSLQRDVITSKDEFLSRCTQNGVEFQGDVDIYLDRVGLWPENFNKAFGVFPNHCSAGTFGSKPLFIRCNEYGMSVILDQTINCEIFKDTRVRYKLHFGFKNDSLFIDRSFIRKIGSKKPQERAKSQGLGIGKRYFKNIVRLCRHMGIREIHARTEEVGGYAHLKTGFLPSDWKELRDRLARKLSFVKIHLLHENPSLQKEIEELEEILTHSENPKDAWKIADSKIPVDFSHFKRPDGKIPTLGQHLYLEEDYGIYFSVFDDPKVQTRFLENTKHF